MIEIFNKLAGSRPNVVSDHTAARLRRRLAAHRRSVLEAADDDHAWKKVRRELRKVRRDVKQWRPAHRDLGALASAVRLLHRRGRKAMDRALTRQRAADFHEWRKQIKALWYQLRLVERRDRRIAHDAAALHRAETWLGDDHNIVVLCAELSKDPSMCGAAIELDRLRLAADGHQCALRERATAIARPIYRRSSNDYSQAMKRALDRPRPGRSKRSGDSARQAA
jgi:hypothetical protein